MPSPHALITGGSSGIGLALARRLAARGDAISLIARDPARLAAAAGSIAGASAAIFPADVADPAQLGAAVGQAVARHGPPTLVVACAGMVTPRPFAEQTAAHFRRSVEVNYLGAVHLVQAALPAMLGGGRIVLVASGAALVGFYGYTSYAPAKFAVRGLGEALRSELLPEGIGVSVVYPPDTDTPGFREEVRRRPLATSRIAAAGRVLSADEVARAILDGIGRGRFAITPGPSMTALHRLHSLIGPWLHRWRFDPIVARWHDRGPERQEAPRQPDSAGS